METDRKRAFEEKCRDIAAALPGGRVEIESTRWIYRARFRCTPVGESIGPDLEFVVHGLEPPANVFAVYSGLEDVPRYDSDRKPRIGVSIMRRSGDAIAKDILSRLVEPTRTYRVVLTERKAKREEALRERGRHMREIEAATGVTFVDRGPDEDPSARIWGEVSLSLRLKSDGSVYVSHGTIGKDPLIAMLKAREDPRR
jgi:hypothetical protein